MLGAGLKLRFQPVIMAMKLGLRNKLEFKIHTECITPWA